MQHIKQRIRYFLYTRDLLVQFLKLLLPPFYELFIAVCEWGVPPLSLGSHCLVEELLQVPDGT